LVLGLLKKSILNNIDFKGELLSNLMTFKKDQKVRLCGFFDENKNPIKGEYGYWKLIKGNPTRLVVRSKLDMYNTTFEIRKGIRVEPNGELSILFLTSEKIEIQLSK